MVLKILMKKVDLSQIKKKKKKKLMKKTWFK